MRNPQIILKITAAWALGCLLSVNGEEWDRFLGPNGHPISDAKSIPAEFTVADYNWQVKIPGKGHSSPVIWGDKLFLTTASGANERKVLCYNTKNGDLEWEWAAPFAAHNKHKFNEFASSTPCLDSQHIYISWSTGQEAEAVALTHEGKIAWVKELGGLSGDHGSASSPILIDGKLFVFFDEKEDRTTTFLSMNPADGSEHWRTVREWPTGRDLKTTYSTPAIYKNSKGVTEIITSGMPFGVLSLDAKTGKELWQYDHDFRVRAVCTPVVSDGVVFAAWGSGNGAKDHVALVPGSETKNGKAKIAWRWVNPAGAPDNKGLPYVPTPLAVNGNFYMWADSGLLQCVEAKTGEIVYGPERIGGNFFSNPILIGGKIYCASLDGELVVVEAGDTFKLVARNTLDSGVNATPAVSGGKLFIRTNQHLISVGG